MRNPVLVLRFVFLSFMFYLNLLALGFAAWNISALKNYGIHVDGAPVFVLMNAFFLFFFLAATVSECFVPTKWAPRVLFECGWTGILSILQLSSALNITTHGPTTLCPSGAYAGACASAFILVVITWISSSTFAMYFIGLLSVSITHLGSYPAIWATAVTAVPWFAEPEETLFDRTTLASWQFRDGKRESSLYENPVFREHTIVEEPSVKEPTALSFYSHDDMEKQAQAMKQTSSASLPPSTKSDAVCPAWAKAVQTRRGVDPPFISVKPGPVAHRLKSCWSDTTTASSPAPPPRALTGFVRVAGRPNGGNSQYDDLHRAANLPEITPSPSRPLSYGIFPDDVHDSDVPITTRGLGQWIRAESASGSSEA